MKYEKLGNIADLIAGQSPPSSSYNKNGTGIPFFQGKADYGKINPTIRNWCNEPTKISLPGDILISVRAPVGPVNINNVESCIGRGLSAIRVKKNVSRDYLYFYLKTNETRISDLGVGSTFMAITQKDLREIIIPVPTLSDQLHIANLLSKAENLITKRKQSITLLDEYLKSTFLEMFGDFKVMSTSKLDFLGDNISYLTSGSRGWAQYYSESGAKFLRIQNIGGGIIRMDNLIHVNPPDSAESERTRVKEGDLLISITADLGRTSVVPKNFGEGYINQHLALIRLRNNINPIYAAYFYNMPFGNNAIQKKNRAAVKAGLNFNDIKSFPISIPSMARQIQFAQIVEKTEALKVQYQGSLQELENLYGSLSQRAFRGELTLKQTDGQELMALPKGGI